MSIPFKTYYAGLPVAPTPVPTDTILLMRGGVLYQMSLGQLVVNQQVKLFQDATVSNTIDLSGYSSALVGKTDSSAGLITVVDTSGNTVPIGPLSVQGETIQLDLYNGIWYQS